MQGLIEGNEHPAHSPGWPLEADGNVGPRWMVATKPREREEVTDVNRLWFGTELGLLAALHTYENVDPQHETHLKSLGGHAGA